MSVPSTRRAVPLSLVDLGAAAVVYTLLSPSLGLVLAGAGLLVLSSVLYGAVLSSRGGTGRGPVE